MGGTPLLSRTLGTQGWASLTYLWMAYALDDCSLPNTAIASCRVAANFTYNGVALAGVVRIAERNRPTKASATAQSTSPQKSGVPSWLESATFSRERASSGLSCRVSRVASSAATSLRPWASPFAWATTRADASRPVEGK